MGVFLNKSVFDSNHNFRLFLAQPDASEKIDPFFTGSEAIAKVIRKKDKPFAKILAPADVEFHWKVCQVATAPFRWVFALFLRAVAKIDRCLKPLKRAAEYAEAGFALLSKQTTQLFKIRSSVNQANREGARFFQLQDVPRDRIPDYDRLEYWWMLRPGEQKYMSESAKGGICSGMSYWFIYLYLRTKHLFADDRAHMNAIGKNFERGGGIESTFLQFMPRLHIGGNFPELHRGTHAVASAANLPHIGGLRGSGAYLHQKYSCSHSSKAEFVDKFAQLPSGAYFLECCIHAMVFIKINNQLGFFFDPSHGVIEMRGDAVGEKLYEHIDAFFQKQARLPSMQFDFSLPRPNFNDTEFFLEGIKIN